VTARRVGPRLRAFRHRVRLGLLAASLGGLALAIGGFRTALSSQGAAPDTLRVVAYNIHHGEGMDGEVDLARIAALVTALEPDLVALQEVDRSVERTGVVDQAARLGTLTGMAVAFGAFMPHQGGDYGMAVLSRWPIVASHNHRLPDGEEPRSALAVRVRSPTTGRELVFVGIHLYRTEPERVAQAARIAAIFATVEVPVMLAGDFNSEPGSPVLALLARTWRFVEKGADRLTFPSTGPEREIDFVAYRPADAFTVLRQQLLDEPVVSDHRPLFVELVWHEP